MYVAPQLRSLISQKQLDQTVPRIRSVATTARQIPRESLGMKLQVRKPCTHRTYHCLRDWCYGRAGGNFLSLFFFQSPKSLGPWVTAVFCLPADFVFRFVFLFFLRYMYAPITLGFVCLRCANKIFISA